MLDVRIREDDLLYSFYLAKSKGEGEGEEERESERRGRGREGERRGGVEGGGEKPLTGEIALLQSKGL